MDKVAAPDEHGTDLQVHEEGMLQLRRVAATWEDPQYCALLHGDHDRQRHVVIGERGQWLEAVLPTLVGCGLWCVLVRGLPPA